MTRRGWIVLTMGGLMVAAMVVCSTQNPTNQAQAQMASSQPGSASAPAAKANPVVVIETSEGHHGRAMARQGPQDGRELLAICG